MSRTQVVAILSGIALSILVLEMVRRRRLREEYSWIWLITAMCYLAVAIWPDLARWMAQLLGSTRPVSAFTFLGFGFLFLLGIQFSMQISRLTEQNKDVAQRLAILDGELQRNNGHDNVGASPQGQSRISSPVDPPGDDCPEQSGENPEDAQCTDD